MPAVLLGVVAAAVLYSVIRGTWADTEARVPAGSAAGADTQLYQGYDGRKVVRAALIVDHPMPAVWAVVTDYDRHSEIFPYVSYSKGTREADGIWRLDATASSAVYGDWPFTARIRHSESDSKCEAKWDAPGGALEINRGGWTLTPVGAGKTLVVFTLDVEVARAPNFFVRTVLLHRLGGFLSALGRWLDGRPRSS